MPCRIGSQCMEIGSEEIAVNLEARGGWTLGWVGFGQPIMARKVNTQFILIVTLVIGFAIIAGGGRASGIYKKKHKDPKQLSPSPETGGESWITLSLLSQHYLAAGNPAHARHKVHGEGRRCDEFKIVVRRRRRILARRTQCWEAAIGTDPTRTARIGATS